MTRQEKNIAIAKMLGYSYQDDKEKSFYNHLRLPNSPEYIKIIPFDSDANWQYEAIEWIENLKFKDKKDKLYYFQMNRCYAGIHSIETTIDKYRNATDKGWEYFCNINTTGKDKKEAVFEALYQFSQHLKNKKQ